MSVNSNLTSSTTNSAATDLATDPPARLVHRLAVLSVCLVWPLIWVGGLVTTYDAGMSVPDWPNTYGYNLFLYPYHTWLVGPFDLFIEHGHRLLGAVVGFVAIALAVAAYVKEPRRWVFGFAVIVLLAVIFQGALGGVRVVRVSRTLAMIHGCFGPAFFASCVALAIVTSRFWWKGTQSIIRPIVPSGAKKMGKTATEDAPTDAAAESPLATIAPAILPRSTVFFAFVLVALSYTQLVLGAQLRHVQPTMGPDGFALIVVLHVMTAFVLWLLTMVTFWLFRRRNHRCGDLTLWRPAAALIGLVGVQIALGVGTWVANYGWPVFLQGFPGATGFLIRAKGFWDSIVVTAHVATGSLILAVSTVLWVRSMRVRFVGKNAIEPQVADDRSNVIPDTAPTPYEPVAVTT